MVGLRALAAGPGVTERDAVLGALGKLAAATGNNFALGHAAPRTPRRYDRSRHNLDRSPNYLLAAALTVASDNDSEVAPQDAR